MIDRELLELAAKAAGVATFDYGDMVFTDLWNPLTDDGDALRLAVKLEIDIAYRANKVTALPCIQTQDLITESFGDDPYAATRRAIVRAAAEIGKGMK